MSARVPDPLDDLYMRCRELQATPTERAAIRRAAAAGAGARRRSPARVALASLVAALLVAAGAVASARLGVVRGFDRAGERHADGRFTFLTPTYATADVRVAHFGRVRLTYRRTTIGDCLGIQTLDARDPAPEGFRAPGLPGAGLSEGCGMSSSFQVASLRDRAWVLAHGRVPQGTDGVELRAPGRPAVRGRVVADAGLVRVSTFVVAVPLAGLCDARIVALGADLPEVGGLDVPGVPACAPAPPPSPGSARAG